MKGIYSIYLKYATFIFFVHLIFFKIDILLFIKTFGNFVCQPCTQTVAGLFDTLDDKPHLLIARMGLIIFSSKITTSLGQNYFSEYFCLKYYLS